MAVPNELICSPASDHDLIYEHISQCARSEVVVHQDAILSYDLRPELPPVEDQHDAPLCSAYTGKNIKEYFLKESKLVLSPTFIYKHRTTAPLHGMYGRDVFNIMQQYGNLPQNIEIMDEPYTPAQYEIAKKYKIAQFARIKSVQGAKHALVQIGPLYVSLPMYSHADKFWIQPPDFSEADIVYGHAVLIVGFTLDTFIIRNSWGTDWGDRGYGYLPFSDWPLINECWVAFNLSDS